jgi:hypothetical protein
VLKEARDDRTQAISWAPLMSLLAFSFGAETAYAQGSKPVLEPKAIELLKAASNRLAAAHTISFTTVVTRRAPVAWVDRWPIRHSLMLSCSGPTCCG